MSKDGNLPESKNKLIKPAIILVASGIAIAAIFYFSNFNVAARVNGKAISKTDYQKRLDAQEQYEKDFQKINFSGSDGEKKLKDLKKTVLDQMIEEEIVFEETSKLNIEASQADIDKDFDNTAKSNGGEGKLNELISKYYGYTKDDFKKLMIKPKVLRQKLQDNILASDEVNKDAKVKAEDVLKQLKNGANFGDLAKKYSDDNISASKGGDLGFIEKGKTVKEFEKEVFAFKEGEISGVFKTVYGYHIIKVLEKKNDKVHVSQILVKTKSFSDWLGEKVKSAKVTTYIKF